MTKKRSAFSSTRAETTEDPTDSYKISELVEIPNGNVDEVLAGELAIAAPVDADDLSLGLQTWKIKYSTILETAGGSVQSTFWESKLIPADTEIISGIDDNGNELTLLDLTSVYVNGVLLSADSYSLDAVAQTLTLSDGIVAEGDVVTIISLRSSQVPYDTPTIFTSDVQTDPVAPTNFSITREAISNQQEANWFLLDKIENIDIPDAPDMEHLATQEWVTEQIAAIPEVDLSDYATTEYVDVELGKAIDAQIEKNDQQDSQISTLENKVDALEGSTTDARYKHSSRPDPNTGEFVLQNVINEKVSQWEQCRYIKMTSTDFENNPHDFTRIYPGDFIRLASSTTNNATYKVINVLQQSQTVTFEVDFEVRGGEANSYEGIVYDFTHFKNLNAADFATISYVDQQDETKLGKDVANMATTGFRLKASASTGTKTFISLATDGQIAIYHLRTPTSPDDAATMKWVQDEIEAIDVLDVSSLTTRDDLFLAGGSGKQNIVSKTGYAGYLCYGDAGGEDERRVAWGSSTVWLYKKLDMQGNQIVDVATPTADNHAANRKYVTDQIAGIAMPDADIPDATKDIKGITYRGTACVQSSTPSSLKEGQLCWVKNTKRLYIGE